MASNVYSCATVERNAIFGALFFKLLVFLMPLEILLDGWEYYFCTSLILLFHHLVYVCSISAVQAVAERRIWRKLFSGSARSQKSSEQI